MQIPSAMKEALKQGASTSGLGIAAHVWLFPDGGGVHTGILAADLAWPAMSAAKPAGSRLQIFSRSSPTIAWAELLALGSRIGIGMLMPDKA